MQLLQSFRNATNTLPQLARRAPRPSPPPAPLTLLEGAHPRDGVVAEAARQRVVIITRWDAPRAVLDLERGFSFDRDLFSGQTAWQRLPPPTRYSQRIGGLLDDRLLRLQIERAVEAALGALESWGNRGQRALVAAASELTAAACVAAVAGATLDEGAAREVAGYVIARLRHGSDQDATTSRSRELRDALVEQIEERAPRFLLRAGPRARGDALAVLRRGIARGARRRRETTTSAHESDLLRLLCEDGRKRRDVGGAAEALFSLLERVQRRVQHDLRAVLAYVTAELELLDELLEEQDWVFGDQGDITYETLRPLQRLRALLREAAAHDPLHLALFAPTTEPLVAGGQELEAGTHVLVGAPLPPDPVEERLAEPLTMTLLSTLLQRLELLPSASGAIHFRRRDR